jgi:two-component system chemotaxis sensor kinase CheA
MSDEDEIVQEFLVESHENLDQLDRDLVQLEKDPGSRELLSRIFRTVHTIKGISGFLAFGRLEALTHVGEGLLSEVRDGELTMTPRTADALLHMVDAVRGLLDLVEHTGSDADDSSPGDRIDRVPVDVDTVIAELTACRTTADETSCVPGAPVSEVAELDGVEPPALVRVVPVPPESVPEDYVPERRTVPEGTVRVDVTLLDTLVQLVGELVLTRNQILQQAGAVGDVELGRAAQRLDVVASELQESVMRTRMQPIGTVWAKFPRIVRDLGTKLGRPVRLVLEGQDTELDRTLLEAVKDPLTHLVRNAIGHGIESPADRVAAGKAAEGTLVLRAYHESGQVVVEITDDGRGIDPVFVGEMAVARGLVTTAVLDVMDQRDVVDLIFRPGFSTATCVTNLSGRGVGMDVVRSNIEHIGGTVDLTTRVGLGTTVRVRIPLTLAIIPALIVGQDGLRFAIPQLNVVELVRLENEKLRDLTTIAGAGLLRLRERLLPVVTMARALGDADATIDTTESVTIVVLQADDLRFGLVVDEVLDTQEIVVKPLGRQLKVVPLYAGATIMGDGQVAIIIDVTGLARDAGVTAVAQPQVAVEKVDAAADVRSLLVLDVGPGRRAALPLAAVSRLEEISAAALERSGATDVVQYRGSLLPLVRLAEVVGLEAQDDGRDTLAVVVHEDGDKRVGVIVDRVVDVVETAVVATSVGRRAGVLGSAVVADRVTDLLDVGAVLALAAGR